MHWLSRAGLNHDVKILGVVLIGVICAPAALAQQTGDTGTSADSGDALEEIVVTAEHRETDVQKTPVTITVLSTEELQAQGQETFDDSLRTVPGVAVRDDPSGPIVVIRGIQPVVQTDPTVNINVDGVYQQTPGSSPTFDLQRTEILKGPQGTQYGRNALGGVVNFVNNTPSADFGGYAEVQYGNYDAARLESAINLPLSDQFESRTAALYSSHNGYLSDGDMDEDIRAVREKLRYLPTDDLTVLLTGEYDHFGGQGPGDVPAPLSSHSNPWYSDDAAGAQQSTKQSGNIEVDWELHWAKLFIQSAYEDYRNYNDQDLELPSSGFTVGETVNINASYEVRLSSESSSALTWQAGLYRLDDKATTVAFPALLLPLEPHPVAGTITGGPSTTKSDAAFAAATYPVTAQMRLTAGIRYTDDQKKLVTNNYSTATHALLATYVGSGSFPAWTYNVKLERDVTQDSLIYAAISRGFKSGGINTPGDSPTSYKPEYINSFEIGSKNEFFAKTLRVNADAYYYDDLDKQVQTVGACNPFAVPSTCPFPDLTDTNASKATIYGVELDSQWNATTNDQFSATVSYNHSRFDKLLFTELGGAPPNFVVTTLDRSGTQLPNAPTWTETLGYQHVFRLGSGARLTPAADVQFVSGDDSDINFNDPDEYQPSYQLVGARLDYAAPGGKWVVGIYGNNLGNVAVRQRAFVDDRLYLMPPRSYGANLNVNF